MSLAERRVRQFLWMLGFLFSKVSRSRAWSVCDGWLTAKTVSTSHCWHLSHKEGVSAVRWMPASLESFCWRPLFGTERRSFCFRFQEYVEHSGSSSDYAVNRYCVRDVHSIGILDLRILNIDRNDASEYSGRTICWNVSRKKFLCCNVLCAGFVDLLVSRKDDRTFSLTPIDHGESRLNPS